jgi:hypothetical protein
MTNACLPLAQLNRDSSNAKHLSLGAQARVLAQALRDNTPQDFAMGFDWN